MFEQTVHDVLHDSIVQINTDASTGSGVVYDGQGDIVTNAHVVEGALTVHVLRNAGASLLPARIIGVSAKNDLAVIRVQTGADTLHPARFGNSDDVKIGQFVLAMGDPLGLTDSVTQGIVSSNRKVTEEPSGAVLTVIQTSAEINPGNSGGGLVDISGNVIGMPTLAVSDPQEGGKAPGIGFAIPSNTIRQVASQLIAHARSA
jgi:putative serine protease PepD